MLSFKHASEAFRTMKSTSWNVFGEKNFLKPKRLSETSGDISYIPRGDQFFSTMLISVPFSSLVR